MGVASVADASGGDAGKSERGVAWTSPIDRKSVEIDVLDLM